MFDKIQELVSKIGEGMEINRPMGERGLSTPSSI
jgi:hypothetical protein